MANVVQDQSAPLGVPPVVRYKTGPMDGPLAPGETLGNFVEGMGYPVIPARNYVPKQSDVTVPNGPNTGFSLPTFTLNGQSNLGPVKSGVLENTGISGGTADPTGTKPTTLAPNLMWQQGMKPDGTPLPESFAFNPNATGGPLQDTPTPGTVTTPKLPPQIQTKIDTTIGKNIPGVLGSNGSSFHYDPSQDEDYKRQAIALTNQIQQAMESRGGLYSSVTQQEVQAGLVDLQTKYRQQRYDELMRERDQALQEAQFALTADQAKYDQWRTEQSDALQASRDILDNTYATLKSQRADLDLAISHAESGSITSADAAILGVSPNDDMYKIHAAITQKESAHQTAYNLFKKQLDASNYAAAKLTIADETRAQISGPESETDLTDDQIYNGKISTLGTTAQQQEYNKVMQSDTLDGGTATQIRNFAKGYLSGMNTTSGEIKWRALLGDALYVRLKADLQDLYDQYAPKNGSTVE